MSVESSSPDRSSMAETLLRDLGQTGASGVLEIRHPADGLSYVWVREGRIYAMQVPGYRPALGIRLLSGGLVSPEQLSTAAAEQRERRPGQLIGEVLVGMGFVSTDIIDAFVREQVLDQVADLLDLDIVEAEFHAGRHIRQGIAEPAEVDTLLAEAHDCRMRRTDALTRVGGPQVIPVLGPPQSGPTQTPLGPYDWALLCRVDGTRDLTELARVCGFTVVEAAQVVADLTMTGLLALPEPEPAPEAQLAAVVALHPGSEPVDPSWRFDGTDAGEPDPVAAEEPDAQAQAASSELLAEFGALLRDEPEPALIEPAILAEMQALAEVAAPDPAEVAALDAPEPDPIAADVTPAHVEAALGEPDLVEAALAEADLAEPDAAPTAEDASPVPEPTALTMVAAQPSDPALSLVKGAPPKPLSLVDNTPRAALTVVDGAREDSSAQHEATSASNADSGPDTTAFMRELSSLSDDPDKTEPVVTRLVVPLTEQRRKRRPWSR